MLLDLLRHDASLRATSVSGVKHVRDRWPDIAAVVVITGFVALVSQRWTGFNSPDSEFYASLALFGSDVTDRTFEEAYLATRLGYIAPVRALVLLFGPWIGFEVWRIFLLLLIVGATYALVHIAGRSQWLAAVLSVLVGLNTVVLAFVGNTYLTGSVLAATFALVALAVSLLGHAAGTGRGALGGPRWTTALVSGLLAGWLLMLNPYAFVLGMGLWLSIRIVVFVRLRTERWHRLMVDAMAGFAGFGIAIGIFLAAGRVIFPGSDWLGTYLEWNSRLDYTVFIGDADTWRRDAALIVVVVSVLASAIATIAQPRHRWAWAALAISTANIAITLAMMVFFTGPWLETPTYIAKLWPAALLALVLVFASMSPGTREGKRLWNRITVIVGAITIPLMLWSGRFDGVLPYALAWTIGLGLIMLILISALYVRRRWDVAAAVLVMIAMAGTFIGAQVLQNGRGLLGSYGQYPFRSAYVDFSYEAQMRSKIEIQQWLLANTSATDTIMIWTDPERLTADVAAMQLWGGDNLASVETTLTRADIERLQRIRPSVLAMYAPDRQQIKEFTQSLPPWALPSDLLCTSTVYQGVGTGEAVACLVRMNWVG